ncbi:MAG: MFS transporter [Kofleriaceae bacterium]
MQLLQRFAARPVRALAVFSAAVAVAMMLAVTWGGGAPASAQPAAPAAAPTAPASPPAAAAAAMPSPADPAMTAPKATADATADAIAKACAVPKKAKAGKPLYEKLLPIGVMILVIVLVLSRLPKVDLGHSVAFRRRRMLNWLPLGLTYSFLYMGRYNIKAFQGLDGGLTEAQYGIIFGVGSAIYGVSFLLNGPLTDRWGGRATIMISACGSAIANLLMAALVVTGGGGEHKVALFAALYGLNMYFQSFGAVSIVKVNTSWFHVRERGTFGGIFGILISLGVFFGYDGVPLILDYLPTPWLFAFPSLILLVFFALCFFWVRNNPSDAGFEDFDLGDNAAPDDGTKTSVGRVMWKIISNPIIFTIAMIELCSGFLRQAILQWGMDFGRGVGMGGEFVFANWGVVNCIAGITGGMFAGAISDHIFQSRRGPVSAVLYGIMLAGAIVIVPLFGWPWGIPWVVAFMSMAIIGVHGMLSGTASGDFGGRKNAGIAVGLIDGFVYIGSMAQSFLYGATLPAAKVYCPDGSTRSNPAGKNIDDWYIWPFAMIPVALLGFVLALRLWNARANAKGGGH